MNLKELVNRAKKGDESAFLELINHKKTTLYKTAYSYTKNENDALDVVSETVYKAFVSINKIKNPEFFNTWLTRILINTAINHVKKNSKVVFIEDSPELREPYDESKPEEYMDLFTAIDRLDGKYKTVVVLKYLQDMTINEIAQVMECPIGTVKTYLHKSLKFLRIELEEVYSNG